MRQRTLAILSLILLQFTLSPLQVASSANIAGKSCSKAGITKINGGLKHTCIKKGKKLIWNKGVATQPLAEAQPQPQQRQIVYNDFDLQLLMEHAAGNNDANNDLEDDVGKNEDVDSEDESVDMQPV